MAHRINLERVLGSFVCSGGSMSTSTCGSFLLGWFFSFPINFLSNRTKPKRKNSFISIVSDKKMSMGPGFYYDIGKKARDLLYGDYTQQSPLHYHYRFFDWNFDLALQIEDIVPGLKAVFRFIVPDSKKVELQYLHDYAGITAGIGLATNPFVTFSSVIGSSFFSLGADLTFDTTARMFTKYNAGLSFTTAFLLASLALNDKGDTLNAACYRTINALTNTGIAAEVRHSFSLNETSLAIGTQHGLSPFTLVKVRVNTYGKAGALIQHEFWPKFSLTVAGEVDARALSFPKIGLSIALRP